jgi:cytochrome c-type biogenesis protein CcmF
MTLGFWVLASNLLVLYERMGRAWRPALLRTAPSGFFGMVVAHIGIGLFVMGVTMVSAYEVEKDVSMAPGDQFTVGDNTFTFQGVEGRTGPNFTAQKGRIEVSLANGRSLILHPEKRAYAAGSQPMTEAAIDPGLTRDLYVSLGEPLGNNAWAVRIYYKPYIRLIWLGCIFMALGGLLGAADKRYRSEKLRVTERLGEASARS